MRPARGKIGSMTQAAEVGRKLTSLRPYTTNTANATELMSAQTIQCRDTCVTKACCARVQGDGCVSVPRRQRVPCAFASGDVCHGNIDEPPLCLIITGTQRELRPMARAKGAKVTRR